MSHFSERRSVINLAQLGPLTRRENGSFRKKCQSTNQTTGALPVIYLSARGVGGFGEKLFTSNPKLNSPPLQKKGQMAD